MLKINLNQYTEIFIIYYLKLMTETIQFGPERQRGDQPARFGRGPSQMVGTGGATRQITRKNMTPNEQAAWNLNQALEKYPDFTEDTRRNLQVEFVDMPGIRTMNMKVLAATLSFLKSVNNQPTPDAFKDEYILPHLSLLLPTKELPDDERRILIVRFKAQLLIYIRAILFFRNG